ncbi:MAG TPA: SDR family oxidoreductase [Vicinamibacterales bacterium]|jgi:NAD(P)-dependent dehydrogenase (short-subunit alcohol dehydrogenase family)|nr:SDR family oxidoreductase [Vicinamibacterales bacterium]
MTIEGSVALVTGASRGLGRALVSALVEAGAAKVYATARDVRTLSASDPRVVPLTLDTTKPEQIAAAALKASDVTLLINNAGAATSYNVLTMNPEALDADIRTNVYGMLGVIKGFLPVLERAPGGATIVNVLSLASLASFPPLGGYSASKAAANSITQALRPELKAKRVDLLAALPGPIDTDMSKELQMPKTSPTDTAKGILAGIARGEEEIFPDPMAQQMGALWNQSHKDYERAFASF